MTVVVSHSVVSARNNFVSRAIVIFALGIVGFWVIDEGLNAARRVLVPKNTGTVVKGVLYRSGQMRPDHFRDFIQTHGIKTVVCLNPGEAPEETQIAAELGLDYHSFPMPGSGEGRPDQFAAILTLLDDPKNHPVLVHCSAGVCRTGVTVALYRILFQGWTWDDVTAEFDFYGLPAYGNLARHTREVLRELGNDWAKRLADKQRQVYVIGLDPELGMTIQ